MWNFISGRGGDNSVKKHENLIEIGAPLVDEMSKRPQNSRKKAAGQQKSLALPSLVDDDDFKDAIEIEYEK